MSITWKDVAGLVGDAAPVVGTLLGGPAGAAIGGVVASALGCAASPDEVSKALATNPDAAVKLRQIEADQAVRLRELLVTAEQNRLVAETASIGAVNATMQSETKAEHWPTYTWRPFIGFAFGLLGLAGGATAAAAYIGVMFLNVRADILGQLPGLLGAEAAVMATMAPILGIASYFRGRMQADPAIPTENKG